MRRTVFPVVALASLAPTILAQSGRVGAVQPDSTVRVFMRSLPSGDEVRALYADVQRLVAREMQGRAELTRASGDRALALRQDLQRVAFELFPRQSQLILGCIALRPFEGRGEGYLGITPDSSDVSHPEEQGRVDAGLRTRLAQFVRAPRVNAVEVGSPAEKAGLRAGDEWVSLEGRPLEGSSLSDVDAVLKPGTRLSLVVRRNGRAQEVSIVPARRAQYYPADACASVSDMIELIPLKELAVRVPSPPRPGVFARGGRAMISPTPGSETMTISVLPGRTEITIYGATFRTLDADARDFVGFQDEGGLLVDRVQEGSPASVAGLRPYDIVLRVNGDLVTSHSTLVNANRSATTLTLQVTRKGETRVITLSR